MQTREDQQTTAQLNQPAPATSTPTPTASSLRGGSYREQVAALRPGASAGMCFAEPIPVSVTARRLNVRSTPSSARRDTIIGRLSQGDTVDVTGQEGDWRLIQYEGRDAYIHGAYTTPIQQATPAQTTAPQTAAPQATEPQTADTQTADGGPGGPDTVRPANPTSDRATAATEVQTTSPEVVDAQTTSEAAQAPQAGDAGADATADDAANPVLQLASDFNNVPVYNKNEAGPEHQPATTYQTPYLLNSVDQADEASDIKRLTIAANRPHAGQKVSDVVGGRPFIGKGTPSQMQVVAQAVIDNEFDGQTPATIQAYVNNGRLRASGNRNGKWGVDCSGLTSQMMSELQGDGREGFDSTNAASFKHDGSRGYTPIHPNEARQGDVISYETTNHVVVVYQSWDVQLPKAGGDATETKAAKKIGVAESTGSRDQATGRSVRTDRRFYYFPGATTIRGAANTSGPEWRLGTVFSETLPVWQPELSQASYGGGDAWTSGYTLNCRSDREGTNIRVKTTGGSFRSTPTKIPNGANGIELKEVEGSMVRIRYNGEDMQDGLEMWAPVRYVATAGEAYSIPRAGQPSGFRASTYSVVRNPNLNDERDGEDGGAPAGGGDAPGGDE